VTSTIDIIEPFEDRERWNDFVAASPSGHFFQSWEWGDLQDAMGGHPRRIAALADGGLVGCVQALIFDGVSRRFAFVPRGPVVDPAEEALASALLNAVISVSARDGASLVRIEPQWAREAPIVELVERSGFALAKQRIMPLRTLLVDLRPSVDDIWGSFRSNTRNRIRLAEKRGVEVRVGTPEDVPSFVRLFEATIARHGLRKADTDAFALAAQHFGSRDTMRFFLARSEGVDISGIVVFLWGTMATYLWGASSAETDARHVNPNQLLHWTAMKWARERGCTTYDLFGIPDHDVEVLEAEYDKRTGGMWNLYRFKRGFRGTVHRHVGTFDAVFRPMTADPAATGQGHGQAAGSL
jgi:lipid II:glycine glycyltransferase (peptidoglycan interpeptide bridge formation enzyme)